MTGDVIDTEIGPDGTFQVARSPKERWTSEAPAENQAVNNPPPSQRVSEKWFGNTSKERDAARKESELKNIHESGQTLSGLMNTEEGRQLVDTTRATLTTIVTESGIIGKPKVISTTSAEGDLSAAQEIRSQNETATEEWNRKRDERVESLLAGGELANTEESLFIQKRLGIQPGLTWRGKEEPEKTLQEFADLRQNIGRAQTYQGQLEKSVTERDIPWLSNNRLRSADTTMAEAQESFAKGWADPVAPQTEVAPAA